MLEWGYKTTSALINSRGKTLNGSALLFSKVRLCCALLCLRSLIYRWQKLPLTPMRFLMPGDRSMCVCWGEGDVTCLKFKSYSPAAIRSVTVCRRFTVCVLNTADVWRKCSKIRFQHTPLLPGGHDMLNRFFHTDNRVQWTDRTSDRYGALLKDTSGILDPLTPPAQVRLCCV